MKFLNFAPLAVAAMLSFGAPANATITMFTDEASFLAALGASGTDTFADLASGAFGGPLVRSAGTFGYTATVGPSSSIFYSGSNGGNIFLSNDARMDTIVFNGFSAGVVGVGGYFFGSNFDGNPNSAASITLSATDADGSFSEVVFNPTTSSYRGFLSTGGLLSLGVLVGNQNDVWPSIDDLTLGTAAVAPGVPEPAAWMLMIAGFGLVGAAMRRRADRFVATRA